MHVLYSDESLKWLAVLYSIFGFSRYVQLQASVNASCWRKAFLLYMMGWISPMASHGRTLARTLCSVQDLNDIAS